MAVVIYKCDTCNRTIDKTRNPEGLEIIGRCTITDNCKGALYKSGTKPDLIARGFPDPVSGLDDWRQRRALYNHDQDVLASTWTITHSLDSQPSIQVFVDRQLTVGSEEYTRMEIEPVSIVYNSRNQATVTLLQNEIGTAQCIARAATTEAVQSINAISNVTTALTVDINNISTNQVLTIATAITDATIDVDIKYLSTVDHSDITGIDPITFGNNSTLSLWRNIETVFIKGRFYKVRAASINVSQLLEQGVVNGTSVYFDTINSLPIEAGDAYLLLTKDPHQATVDRDFNNIIDLSIATNSNAATSFLYNNTELFAFNDIKENIFPAISISK